MPNNSIYDTLLDLPLFRGASRERLSEIVGVAKFHFVKFGPGEIIFNADESCTHLRFILSGKVRLSFSAGDGDYEVSQTLEGPDVLLPDYLFGRITTYPAKAEALTPVALLQIEKADYLRILTMDQVFMINLLNYLSMDAQKSLGSLSLINADIERKIAIIVNSLTQPGARDIEIVSRGLPLEQIFSTDATTLQARLLALERSGLVTLDAGVVRIRDRRALMELTGLR